MRLFDRRMRRIVGLVDGVGGCGLPMGSNARWLRAQRSAGEIVVGTGSGTTVVQVDFLLGATVRSRTV